MDLPVNRFKQRLRSGEAQIGLWLGLADPYCAELAANAGFDWLLLDGEHAPNDLRSLLGQLQALAPYPGQPVIRPVQGDTALIKQLLDIGAQTLLVPMVDSAAQAEGLVRAVRYPPAGVRGVGSALARASRWNSVAEYLDHADEQMCLLVQVETWRAWPTSTRSPLSRVSTACSSVRPTSAQPWAIAAIPAIPRCRRPSRTPSAASARPARPPASSPPTRRWRGATWSWAARSSRWAWTPAC